MSFRVQVRINDKILGWVTRYNLDKNNKEIEFIIKEEDFMGFKNIKEVFFMKDEYGKLLSSKDYDNIKILKWEYDNIGDNLLKLYIEFIDLGDIKNNTNTNTNNSLDNIINYIDKINKEYGVEVNTVVGVNHLNPITKKSNRVTSLEYNGKIQVLYDSVLSESVKNQINSFIKEIADKDEEHNNKIQSLVNKYNEEYELNILTIGSTSTNKISYLLDTVTGYTSTDLTENGIKKFYHLIRCSRDSKRTTCLLNCICKDCNNRRNK